ncbi:hypothetical protein Tco_0048775 [Tanacetum coccineum]
MFTFHRYCTDLDLINLCFADDLFLFAHGDVDSAKVIMDALDEARLIFVMFLTMLRLLFYMFSHLKKGVFRLSTWWVPLVSSRPVYRDCRELIEKVRGRVMDWKNKSLSIMRGFLWCQGLLKKGKANVSWDIVCRKRIEGVLGVKWIHVYKLNGRSFWEVPCRGNLSWGWRKIFQLRPLIREFIWYRIGDGLTASAWFDSWCHVGPISRIVTSRDIFRAGYDLSTKVNELVVNGSWGWPN